MNILWIWSELDGFKTKKAKLEYMKNMLIEIGLNPKQKLTIAACRRLNTVKGKSISKKIKTDENNENEDEDKKSSVSKKSKKSAKVTSDEEENPSENEDEDKKSSISKKTPKKDSKKSKKSTKVTSDEEEITSRKDLETKNSAKDSKRATKISSNEGNKSDNLLSSISSFIIIYYNIIKLINVSIIIIKHHLSAWSSF